jgi:hypothetical protein
MRSVLIAALSAALLAPAAWAQEGKPRPPEDVAPGPLREPGPVAPVWDAPHAGDPAPPTIGAPGDAAATPPAATPVRPGGPLHPGDEVLPPDADKGAARKAPPKPRLDEAAGGLAGGVIGQVAGTAVGGPVGGIAASLVGGKIGTGVVRIGRKVLGRDKKPPEQPAAAEGRPAAATEPSPPAQDAPRLVDAPS